MTKTEEQMRDFISAEIKNRDFEQEQLDKLAEVLYPHDGSDESVRSATRQFGSDMIKWESNEQMDRKTPKPMTDAEIEALAAMM